MCIWFDFPMPLQRGRGWDREGSVEIMTLDSLDLQGKFIYLEKGSFFALLKLDILHLQSSRLVG